MQVIDPLRDNRRGARARRRHRIDRIAERQLVALPPPQPRRHLHTRRVTFEGYLREDGMWDIEARMGDEKTYVFDSSDRGSVPPGDRVHDMLIRVTLDDGMTIRAIETEMASSPFPECPRAEDPMQQMVGQTMGPGWRFAVDKALGATRGCTHMRELLFNMATAAYQTIFPYRSQKAREAGLPRPSGDRPPYHLGKCMSWDFDGPVVRRHYPEFAGWQALQRMPRPE